MSKSVEESQDTKLKHLTDEDLIKYYNMLSNLSRRQLDIKRNNYDSKKVYHVVRLVLECEQILVEHDLDLERNSEILKSVRRGEWTLEEIKLWFSSKEKDLEGLYHSSDLRYTADEHAIKVLLNECLEMHYGNLSNLRKEQPIDKLIIELEDLIKKFKG